MANPLSDQRMLLRHCLLLCLIGSLMIISGNCLAIQPSYSPKSKIIAGILPAGNISSSDTNIFPDSSLFMDGEAGILYFYESYRIRKITLATGIISTVVCNSSCLIRNYTTIISGWFRKRRKYSYKQSLNISNWISTEHTTMER